MTANKLLPYKIIIFLFLGVVFLFTIFNYNSSYSNHLIVNNITDNNNEIDLRKRNFQYFDTISSWTNSQVPWYVAGGTVYPAKSQKPPKLLAEQEQGDRILEQLMYVPEGYEDAPKQLILSYEAFPAWDGYFGRSMVGYSFEGCPVNKCILTDDKNKADVADAVLFKQLNAKVFFPRPRNQIWILLLLESPYHTPQVLYPNLINWTATYRHDSDISIPYGKWVYYNPQVRQKNQNQNFAANKTKKVAWFVSNCKSKNNRLKYARQLRRHIQVDIYGSCGSLQCPRTNRNCFDSLAKDYKFYLAFENSNCRDYVTEKLFENAFGYNVLPIVMGTKPENYRAITPQNSFIHVDDFSSPADLAAYLHKLDQDDDLYNSYFQWKGTGEFINHHFWCRLCAMLHADLPPKNYKNINDWWFASDICT